MTSIDLGESLLAYGYGLMDTITRTKRVEALYRHEK